MTYLRIGALLAFLALAAVALWYRGNAISAQAERDRALAELQIAVGVNKAQQETIGRLRAQAERDARETAELLAELGAIKDALLATGSALTELRQGNENVRDYLDTPVPDDLRRLYDR